jgi:hypothetical protein
MPKNHEAEFFISLAPGKAMRVRATVFEEGFPTPGEADLMRQPDCMETLELLGQIPIEKITLAKPF